MSLNYLQHLEEMVDLVQPECKLYNKEYKNNIQLNIIMESVESTEQKSVEIDLLNVNVENENMALNVLISFITIAQKRGAYSIPEASKIWECVQKFQKKD